MDCEFEHVDECVQGLEWNYLQKAVSQMKLILFVLDDLFDEAAQSQKFLALDVSGRHRNVHLRVLRPNLFHQGRNSETIDLNVTQLNLFNSPRDSEQIGVFGFQLGDRKTTI